MAGNIDYGQACALLGVPEQATQEQAQGAYKLRAQMLHPDKHAAASEAVRAEAQRAMQQVNEAWEVYQQGVPQQRSAPPYEPPATRPPGLSECHMCGSYPAAPFQFDRVTGFVLAYKVDTVAMVLCRACAINVFREAQAGTLVRGWWGPFAALRNLWVLLKNLRTRQRLREMPGPLSRADDVLTPLPFPMPAARSVPRRLGPWLATAAAFWTVMALVGAAVEPSLTATERTQPATNEDAGGPADWIGACADVNAVDVSCDSAEAHFQIDDYVQVAAECERNAQYVALAPEYTGGLCVRTL